MLHGFTGSGESFDHINSIISKKYTVFALDLIGHGHTNSPENPELYSLGSQIDHLNQIINSLSIVSPVLWGYSMGGRLALNFAINFPEKISGLILESTSNGIESDSDRIDRLQKDMDLSNQISKDYTSFLQKWNRLPLFKSPPMVVLHPKTRFLEIQNQQNPIGLSHSVLQFSPAHAPYIFKELEKISVPVLLLTGQLDEKYTQLWDLLKYQLKQPKHKIIQNAGHRVHLDNPVDYIKALENYLTETNLK